MGGAQDGTRVERTGAYTAPVIVHRAMAAPDRRRALQALREAELPSALLLSAPGSLGSEEARGVFRTQPLPRLHLVLKGGYHLRTATRSGPTEQVLGPGAGAYWTPNSVSEEIFDSAADVLGASCHATYLRLIRIRVERTRTISATSWHTPSPPSATLLALAAALDRIATQGADLAAAPHLFRALLGTMAAEAAATAAEDLSSAASPTWERTLAYVEDHLGEPINCKTVARAMDLHPNYLSRLAPQQAGLAFKDVLKRLRLARAAELLTRTRWPIGQVALACGYASSGYFIKVFARARGVTPTAYRRDHAE